MNKWKIFLLTMMAITMSNLAEAICLNPLELLPLFEWCPEETITSLETPVFESVREPPDYTFTAADEEINVSYYMVVNGEKVKVLSKTELKEESKFGFEFNESSVDDEIKTKKGTEWDKKIYFEISGMEEYEQIGDYAFAKDLPVPSNTLGLRNRRILDFSDIFSKTNNLYNFTTEEVNETICIEETNITNEFNETETICTKTDIIHVNKTIRKDRVFNYSFSKVGDKLIAEFYNLYNLDPSFIDNLNSDFGKGTLWRTNITNGNGGANVTLNYTTHVLKGDSGSGNMSSGQRMYNLSGNFTSQVFDTSATTSVFDKIMWDSELVNGSDVIGYMVNTDTAVNDMAVFFRNGSFAVDTSQSDLSSNIAFTNDINAYTLPSGWSYDDIVGFDWRDDAGSDKAHVFFRNGSIATSTLSDGAAFTSNIAFTSTTSFFTLPIGINTSNIIGFGQDFDNGDEAVFLKNGSVIIDLSGTAPPFQFASFSSFSIPSNFNIIDVIGVAYQDIADDAGIFFRNGSYIADTSQTTFTTAIVYSNVLLSTYSSANITESTNITLQTHVGNTTPITTPWSSLYINNSFVSDVDVNNNVGRYIQYKAVFTTPDKYITPQLENVSINYTMGSDFIVMTMLVNTTDRLNFSYVDGNFSNTRYNSSIGAIQTNKDATGITLNGTFQSQVFDLGTTQSFKNISWTEGAAYGEEIGRYQYDSNNPPTSNGIFPNISINTSGLVGLWYFNNESGYGENNSLVRDFSPDVNAQRAGSVRYNGTCSGTTCPLYNFTSTKLGRANMWFDGSNDYVNISSTVISSQNNSSISLWFNPTQDGVDSDAGLYSEIATDGNGYHVMGISGTKAEFCIYNGVWNCIAGSSVFKASAWYHMVATLSASGIKIYVNGVLEGSSSYNTKTTETIVGASIGSTGPTEAAPEWFNGFIDEVSVWNRTLSSAEISQLYKRGAYRLNISTRSCDDALCAGEDYSVNATNSTSSSISTLSNNRYVQYKAFFTSLKPNSENSTAPELYNVTVHYAALAGADVTSPTIKLGVNISTMLTTSRLNISFNFTDETMLSAQNLTINWTTGKVFLNFTNDAVTSIDLHNVTSVFGNAGDVVNISAFGNDSSNNRAEASLKFTINTPVTDTCSCPHTGILCSDNCVISSDCDEQGNAVYAYGTTGSLTLLAKVYNFASFYSHGCPVYCHAAGGCY